MNKKIKNIASVVQTKSAAVLCTLCVVLFLASCNDESLVDTPHAQNAFRTVSVDLGMPQGKPAYGDGTDSRAQMADTTATGYRLSFDTAETGKPDASRAGSNNWIDGDRLLLHIVASNEDQTTQTTEGMLTLTYSDSKWSLDAMNSYTKYGASFVAYNSAQPKLLITDNDTNIDLANLKMHVDEKIGMSANVTATLVYAPHMKWSFTEGSVTLVVDETASTYEKWEWTNTNSSWTTPYARLRVNTGNGNAGDVVTLTSSAFDSAWEVEPTEGEGENAKTVYTATTDTLGNAYFYGITNGTLTDNFLVELTQMRVPVPTAAPASEGRSITLVDESTLLIDLDEPITLLEASDVVPVTLAAETAYKLMAEDKRNTAKTENINSLSVIDGQCGITEVRDGLYWGTGDQVAAVKKQIETAVAMGVTDFTVVNQLAIYEINMVNPTCAATVVGEAIRQLVPEPVPTSTEAVDYNGSITLTLADATMVIDAAFLGCTALQSVTAPAATWIGSRAFIQCTGLEEVELDVATQITPSAFFGCTALQSVLAPAATEIGESVFDGCSSLQSVSLGNVTTISSYAFQNTQVTNLNFDYLTTLGGSALSGLTFSNLEMGKEAAVGATITLMKNAFTGCRLTGSVTFHKVVKESGTNDGLTQKNAFYEVATSELDLFLHAEQPIAQISVSNGKLKWAGAEWASITLLDGPNGTAGTKYYIDNGMPTVEVDGTCGNKPSGDVDDYNAMKNKIEVVAMHANNNIPAKVIVKKGLALYNHMAKTVVGAAIERGIVHLVLDDAITSIPEDAFFHNMVLVSVTTSATTIGESAFYDCTSLTNVSLRATSATTIGMIAFMACSHLATVDLSANTAIGESAFKHCLDLTSMDWTKVTSIGVEAFLSCSSLTGELSLPNVTSIGDDSFQGCTFTKVTFGKVVTGYESTFEFANVSNCDLELAAGQSGVTTENGKLMWAGAEWKSITVGDVQYKAVGNELYAVIDGTVSGLNLSTYVQKGNLKFYVVNGLSGITKAFTIAGTGASEGSISLVLDEGITDIPRFAFQDCNALGSVVANGVETIEYGAFSGTLAIRELTFKKVISCTSNYAFGQQPQNDYYWTFSCTLTLNESQSGVYDGDDITSVTWGSCFWGCIKIGDYEYNMQS